MDLELQKLVRLKQLEHNLTTLLQEIDVEINQTAMEWMHLTSLVEENYGNTQPSEQQNNLDAQKRKLIELKKKIDDDSNSVKLNLTIENSHSNTEEDEEEEESE